MVLHSVRNPTAYEAALFEKLTEQDFPGKDLIKRQLSKCQVGVIDEEGSIKIHSALGTKAPVRFRVPVEARGKDTDGVGIEIILHVIDGIVDELEILKDDGSRIKSMPDVRTLELTVYPIAG
jgi:hypothetical protein